MTGVSYDDVCAVIGEKLELRDNPISCTISLLDPRRDDLMSSIAPVFSRTPKNLSDSILNTIHDLFEFQKTLSPAAQERLHIRVHATIPSGSAILIDHGEPFGRIQIETKPYGAPLRDSFAFEVMKTEARGLYDTLVLGYTNLIADGDAVRPEFFLFTRIESQDEHTFDASDITWVSGILEDLECHQKCRDPALSISTRENSSITCSSWRPILGQKRSRRVVDTKRRI